MSQMRLSFGVATFGVSLAGIAFLLCFFFQAEDGIRDWSVTGVQTCALPISRAAEANRVRARRALRHPLLPRLPRHRSLAALLLRAGAVDRRAPRSDHAPRRRPRKIGRASCRERGESPVVGRAAKEHVGASRV